MKAIRGLLRAEWEKKVLAAALLWSIMTMGINFCGSVFSCLALFFHHTVEQIPDPVLQEGEGRLIYAVSLFLALSAALILSKRFVSLFYGKPRKWYLLLAVPLFMIVAVFRVANWGAGRGILLRSGGDMGLYYDQLFSYAGFIVLGLLSMAVAGLYVFGMERIYVEQQKSERYHAQIAAYQMLEEQYGRAERLRHDLKNHVLALGGLWEDKEWDKLGTYLKQMENSAELGAGEEATGSRAVDALLSEKKKMAGEKGIRWECGVQMLASCHVSEFDFCVLFGNLLDNAIESCERVSHREEKNECQPFIRVHAGTVKKCFLLEVTNSADGTELPARRHSWKENPQEHGIGLLNVGDVVHRYDGTMQIETKNDIFVISILLPLRETVYDREQAF